MTFGRREQMDRRAEPRGDVSRQAALYYGDNYARVSGFVRNISRNGACFIVDSPVNLPREVVLQFWNGDELDCEVVRDVNDTEFGLWFKDASEFDQSRTGDCVSSIQHFTRNQTPHELYQLVEEAGFFGDEEIADTMKTFIASFDKAVEICSDRILPH